MKKIENKEIKNRMLFLILNVFVVIAFVSSASAALGVAYANPIYMYPGESKDTFFILQNADSAGDREDLIVDVLPSDSPIATFTDRNLRYNLPYGAETRVNIRLDVPENARIGARYTISALFKPSVAVVSGGAQIVGNIRSSFDVVVVEKPAQVAVTTPEEAKAGVNIWLWIIVIIIIVIFLWVLLKSKKKTAVKEGK